MKKATSLRIHRHLAGLSQAKLAENINRDQAWVSRAERNIPGAAISDSDAARIAQALGVPPEKLFEADK